MNVETIINGKRMTLREPMPYIEIAFAPEAEMLFRPQETDPLRSIRPITIRKQRHRLVRLVAEYELDGQSY